MPKFGATPVAGLVVAGLGFLLAFRAMAFGGGACQPAAFGGAPDRPMAFGAVPRRPVAFGGVPCQPSPSIRGTWAAVGEENATFVISKDSIYYPDNGAAYKYTLVKDSLHIRYDGFDGNYRVKMKGRDTLILTGDERSVYYRFGRSN